MKKLLIFLYLIVLSVVAVFAESTDIIVDDGKVDPNEVIEVADEALKVDIVSVEQAYPSLRVNFRITIDSAVDSGRAVIQWYYPQNMLDIVGENKSNIMLTSNTDYTAEKYFDIANKNSKLNGVTMFTIGAKVTALVYEENYITIVKRNFYFDSNFQLLPIDDTFREAKTNYQVMNILYQVGAASVVMLVVSFGLGKFLKYVNSPDKEK